MICKEPVEDTASESVGNKFKNCRQMNIHRYSDDVNVSNAIKQLSKIIDYKGGKREKQCKIIVLDLYHCYKGDKSRYIKFYLSPNSYDRIQKYNHFNITFDIVKNLTEKLFEHGYIDVQKGFNDVVSGHNECSKMIAKQKLISYLEDEHGVTQSMVSTWKDKEVIILKDHTQRIKRGNKIVKIRQKKEYEDNAKTILMRKAVQRYNELLERTYIDLDDSGFNYVRKIKDVDINNKKKIDPLRIDLSLKRVYRVFNGDFEHGGRWYGPFWQGCPEALRSRIIIEGSHTVEFDFSGLHIHLLYALKKQKLGDREPYIVSKVNDPDKLRKIYKLIMLTSVNCKNDHECIAAVEDQLIDDMEEEPDKYPDKQPDLWKMLKELKEHHKTIEDYINKKTGLMLQYIDSSIVEDVIHKMTKIRIPVLSVHDSFICMEKDSEVVHNAMKESFVMCISKTLGGKRSKFSISVDDVFTTTCEDAKSIFPAYKRLNKEHMPKEILQNKECIRYPKCNINAIKVDFGLKLTCLQNISLDTLRAKHLLIPHNKLNTLQNKRLTWSYTFNNKYSKRLIKYLNTRNPVVNEVIKLNPSIIQISRGGT